MMLKRQDIDLCGVDLEDEIPLKPRNMSSKQFNKMYRALEEHKVYFEKFTFSGRQVARIGRCCRDLYMLVSIPLTVVNRD